MTVYLNHTNKYLYILAVVYILEFGHNPFRKMVIINFGGGVQVGKGLHIFGVGKRVWRAHKNGFWGVQGQSHLQIIFFSFIIWNDAFLNVFVFGFCLSLLSTIFCPF